MTDFRDQVQSTLGDAYRIERELGGGGMSRVFVARESAHQRPVVIKVLPAEMAASVSIERFKREIALAARLQHPHIVPLLTSGDIEGLPYFTMPFVDGESLRARLTRGGELPVGEGLRILREVASALDYAHEQGVVHRDIKPDNVLLSRGSAMVSDFGVAKALSASSNAENSGMTSLGVALGTPAYMSPEQAAANPNIDARADVYAYGVMAYELFAGRAPFAGRSPQAMLAAHVIEPPEPIQHLRPALPSALASLIMQCLEKHPADRPQSAADIVHALDAIHTPTGMTPSATVPTEARPRRARGPVFAVAGAVILVILAGGAYFARGRSGAIGASPTVSTAATSVAVLPFVNVGGDTANEYFADGLTDELAAVLAGTGKLRVAARSSSFAFKGKTPKSSDVGKQLNVSTIVEGSVQRAGGRLKVRASLVNAADGLTTWSDTYERDGKDVFAVQAELAQAIAGALRVSLTGEQVARGVGTRNQAAHDLLLRGRHQEDVFTEASLRDALKLYGQAIALDSNYADAWAGIASTWFRLADDYVAPTEALPHIRPAIERAMTLDSTSAQAHGQLAALLFWYDRDFPRAQREFERALRADSTNASTHSTFAEALLTLGMRDSAIAVLHRAERVDPLSLVLARDGVGMLVSAGDLSGARRACARARELDPVRFSGCEAVVAMHDGRFPMTLDSARVLARTDSSWLKRIAVLEAKRGMKAEARRDIAAYIARFERAGRYLREEYIVRVYALIGDKDEAIKWLERGYAANSAGMVLLRTSPEYRSLYGDPRYEALVKKVGLK